MVVEVNKLVKSWISKDFYYSVLKQGFKIIKTRKKIDNISVALVGGQTIKNLNKKYRHVNQVTDVLAFNDPVEIIVCWPQLIKQANEQKHSQKKELAILLIHGLLHILGYDHQRKTDKTKMEKQSDKIISLLKKKKLVK